MNGMGSFAPRTPYARLMLKPLKKHWNKETVGYPNIKELPCVMLRALVMACVRVPSVFSPGAPV